MEKESKQNTFQSDILLQNVAKIHTTELGQERIRKNLQLDAVDTIKYIRKRVLNPDSSIERIGKNWYVMTKEEKITINAYNYCVITAHKLKKETNN